MEIKRSDSSLFAKGPAEWFGTGRFTYPTINALRAVAFLVRTRDGGARRLGDAR